MLKIKTFPTNRNDIKSLAHSILFEDNHLLIVNKAAGVLVQGDQTGDTPLVTLLKDYLKYKYNKPGNVFLGVVHRLDRPTSGVVVFARTSKALTRLNQQFANRTVEKIYWTLVSKGLPKTKDRLAHWLVRNPKKNKSFAFDTPEPTAKKAVLHYHKRQTLDRYELLEIQLETGRHHQIRAQLAAIGFPIKGDLKYGAARSNDDGSIDLHARQITLWHPVKKEPLTVVAPLPNRSLWSNVLSD